MLNYPKTLATHIFFNKTSKGLPKAEIPTKTTILSMEVAENGQSKPLLVQIQEGSFVVKPSFEALIAIFYYKVGKELNISIPDMNYCTKMDQKYQILTRSTEEYLKSRDLDAYLILGNKFSQIFYEIVQYVPSINLSECSAQAFKTYLLDEDSLKQLGNCLAFDIIINNSDRFQLLWGNQGNPDNILIQIEQQRNLFYPKKFVFIDNIGNWINVDNPHVFSNCQRYFHKVKQFYRQIFSLKNQQEYKKEDYIYFSQFVNQLSKQINHSLTVKQIHLIIQAILNTTKLFLKLVKENKIKDILQQLYKDIQQLETKPAYKMLAKDNLSKINYNFCRILSQNINSLFDPL